jgi:hypothetical protein
MDQFQDSHMTIETNTRNTRQIDRGIVQQLRDKVRGPIFCPGDNDFDTVRRVFNLEIDKFPAIIVQCLTIEDVIRALDFAHAHQLLTSVRGSGHNIAGNAVCDGGIVIDLSHMKKIEVIAKDQVVHAEPGVIWGEFDRETQKYGLATPGGTVSSTGIAGLTLGGGFGWLLGKYGLTCDNLLAANIVTADGRFLHTNAEENADLFWGLRGGGGNFGIVTSFTYRAHPVDQVLGGTIVYPLQKGREVLQFFRSFTQSAPVELTASTTLLVASDGTPVVTIDLCYAGSVSAGEKVLKPLLKFGTPLKNHIRLQSYGQFQTMYDSSFVSGQRGYWKSGFLTTLSDEAIDVILTWFKNVASARTVILLDHLHGAMHRVGQNETAFSHREAKYSLLIASIWSRREEADSNRSWTRGFFHDMESFFKNKVYVNCLGEEGETRVIEAYGADKYEQLALLKQKYDPENFFRMNQNIKPKSSI